MKKALVMSLFFLIGCASGITGLLRFQDRELLIHPDKPGLAYPHKIEVCSKRKGPWRVFGKKCKSEHKIDFYDLNDKSTREKLINSVFTCKSALRFKY